MMPRSHGSTKGCAMALSMSLQGLTRQSTFEFLGAGHDCPPVVPMEDWPKARRRMKNKASRGRTQMTRLCRLVLAVFAATSLALSARPSVAQTYPSNKITLIVAFAAGGV